MVRRRARACRQIGITMAQPPTPHRIPIRLGHSFLLHVKCAHVDRVRSGVCQPVERITHGEIAAGNDREIRQIRQQIAHLEPEFCLGGRLVVPIQPRVPGDAQVRAGGDVGADRSC